MKLPRLIMLALLLAALSFSHDSANAQDAAERQFVTDVLPLLKSKCFACHGEKPDDIKGEFDVTSRAGLLRGGESKQPSIVPGKPASSLLISAVKWDELEMPPKENDRLTPAQIKLLEGWIEAGAPWPGAAAQQRIRAAEWSRNTADGVLVKTSGGLADEWTYRRYDPAKLWAYRPLAHIKIGAPPSVDPIDALLARDFAAKKIEPAPLADRRTLIRRATFDLLGLPPTPEEIEAFVSDPASDHEAFARLVDRLLDSPHYGEQWARHWLDVVRYADSSGFANDYERGNAWRYRDYVVRAFNDDKPYDQFIREQLAGDEIDPKNPELLIAAGFLRMGPWELTGMEVAKIARQRFLDDVTDAVGEVFLGHMLQCARCHDHKFDPVPTRDYYSIQAAFATTQFAERPAEFLPQENTAGFEERKYLRQREQYYTRILEELDKKSIAAGRAWYAEQKLDAAEFEKLLESSGSADRRGSFEAARRKLLQQGVPEEHIPPRHAGFTPQDYGMERVARKGLERLRWALDRYEPLALSVYSGRTPELKSVNAPLRMPANRMTAGELEETCILAVGDPFSPKDKVTPGVLSAANTLGIETTREGEAPAEPGSAHTLTTSITGRRLELADWIASKQNPLTARVMVNRIWQWHFGRAIAGNPNNFGATGKLPTEPELLDYLAGRFIEDGWSIKAMHRLIMNSEAYRRASSYPEKDAHGAEQHATGDVGYAVFQPRRLDAEELRDAMLSVSGELNPKLGGIPIRPEMNLEAALQPRMVMGTFAEAWQPSPLPEQRHRRSLYALRLRGQRDPFQEVFNAPASDRSCEAREASTVTPQVFAMFNSEISFDRALALANRVLREKRGRRGTIDRLFTLTFGRPASEQEIDLCLAHWDKMTARHKTLRFDPPEYPKQVVREGVEENTGEKFTFVEPLEVYADFVPDLKPSDAAPELRGLAEVCLVLLNANEFAYVY